MQMEADQVARWIDGVGEPTLEAEAFALQATLAAVPPAQRRGRPRAVVRRLPVLAAIAILVLCVSVVALADVGGLFSGAPAPPAVRRALSLGSHEPAWDSTRIEATKARELMRTHTASGDLVLWIAPTRDGNLCLALQRPGEARLEPACIRHDEPAGRIGYMVDDAYGTHDGRWRAIWGRVPSGAASLSLSFSTGSPQRVGLSHGFFIAPIGERSPALLVARDTSGRVVARQRVVDESRQPLGEMLRFRADGSPEVTVPHTARVLIRQRTWAGDLTLSTAPSIFGGPCEWETLAGKTSHVGCEGSLDTAHPLSFAFMLSGAHGRPTVVFSAQLPPDRFSGVRFRFEDGRVVTRRVRHGWVLYGFPPIADTVGHGPASFDLLGLDGRVVRHQAFANSYAAMFSQILAGRSGRRLQIEIREWTRSHRG